MFVVQLHSLSLGRSQRDQKAYSTRLMEEWDPIRVKDIPEAADEYDSHLGEVYGLIVRGASIADLGGCSAAVRDAVAESLEGLVRK